MHNGQFDTLEEIINFYREVSDFQRAGRLRNGDPELGGIHLTAPDIRPLAAFLKSLNEDYE
jgi:cytochrome c peroxidase